MKSLVAAALCGGFFMGVSAHSETLCGERNGFGISLLEDYGELPIASE
jgi:hypothetical protein